VSGTLQPGELERFFADIVLIVLAGEVALLARLQSRELRGFWATDVLVVGAARGAVAALIGTGST